MLFFSIQNRNKKLNKRKALDDDETAIVGENSFLSTLVQIFNGKKEEQVSIIYELYVY